MFHGLCTVTAAAAALLLLGAAAPADRLPLGDGKISNSPRAGYVYSCQTRFHGGGAHRRGPWIGRDSWDPAAKPTVSGSVPWPDSRVSISIEGDHRVVRANNLPRHPTGTFPVPRSDEAYRYDRNPNHIASQDILLSLPARPARASRPACVPMGMIGFTLSGVALFNALDAQGRDAPAHEIQDSCNGHPERSGQYHYHDYSSCMGDKGGKAGRHGDLVGYMTDGFGIYGPHGEDGGKLASADLDACHGHVHTIAWDGAPVHMFHYHLTPDFPYTAGCLRGTPVRAVASGSGDRRPRMRRPGGPPGGGPREALRRAAQELGVDAEDLRRAVGPPPPDFARAARMLNIDAARIRDAMQRARGR